MTTTTEIEPGRRIDPSREVVGIDRTTRRAVLVQQEPGRAPERIDGVTIGAPQVTGDSPHDGEVHPDGDEVLLLVSGAVSVRLELPEGDRVVEMAAGDLVVVPQGIWHQVVMREPGQLVHITPGPGGDARVKASNGGRS